MDKLIGYLPFLIPVAVLELVLLVVALVHILTHKSYKHGSRALWIVIVILFEIIGPIVYFVIGRSDE